jgi:fructose-specific phosphotransferase system IIC component
MYILVSNSKVSGFGFQVSGFELQVIAGFADGYVLSLLNYSSRRKFYLK